MGLREIDSAFVTGATGFIGRRLVAELLRSGVHVKVLVRNRGANRSWPTSVEEIVGDVGTPGALAAAAQSTDIGFHLAGYGSPSSPIQDHAKIIQTNVIGTMNVLTAAADAGVQRVVVASSASVYGRLSSTALREDMLPEPLSAYALSKLTAEYVCELVHNTRGLETVALRYFNVYGPGEDSEGRSIKLLPTLVRRLRARDPVTLFGDGMQTRDFVHVDDAVSATLLSGVVPGIDHLVANVGSGESVSVADVVRKISNVLNIAPDVVTMPPRPYEVRFSGADISVARRALGYRPKRVPFGEFLQCLISEDGVGPGE